LYSKKQPMQYFLAQRTLRKKNRRENPENLQLLRAL
jgi:hypothetical protein